MSGHRPTGRLAMGIAIFGLIAGCSSGSSVAPTAPLSPTAAQETVGAVPTTVLSPSLSAVPTASAPDVVETNDVAYEQPEPQLAQGTLDVYAPSRVGAWPVVVMLHGSPPTNTKLNLSSQARAVAAQGFVVFVPSWGHLAHGEITGAPTYDQLRAILSETACAVAFARTHAHTYGGDPSTMIVFGHSAGASIGAVVAFARPTPTPGCIGGTDLGAINALVTWDGDWMAIDPTWDAAIVADPRLLDLYTPLKYVAEHKDMRVVLLASENPFPYVRDLHDPAALAALFAVRDPSGNLRRILDANGALSDGQFDILELQRFFYSYLKANGNPVSLDVLPGATHDVMGGAAVPVFVAAFKKATTTD